MREKKGGVDLKVGESRPHTGVIHAKDDEVFRGDIAGIGVVCYCLTRYESTEAHQHKQCLQVRSP